MFDNVRRVSRQIIAYGTADVSILAINILLLPVFTRVLSPDEYGVFTLLLVFEALLKPALRCGLDGAFLRHYFEERTDRGRRSLSTTVLVFAVGLNVAALLLLWPAGPLLTRLFVGSSQYVPAIRLVALNTALSNLVFLPLAQFRAEERAALVGTLNFARSLATVIARLVLVVGLRLGVTGMPLADVVVTSALALALSFPLVRMLRGRFSLPVLRDVLRYGFPQVPNGVLNQVMSQADRYVTGVYLPFDQTGIYGIGSTMASVLKLFPTAFETAWMPFAFSELHRPDAPKMFARMATYAFGVLCLGALGASLLVMPVVTLVLPTTYHRAPVVVPLLIIGIVFQAAAWFMNTSLNVAKRTATYPVTTTLAAIVSLAGSLLLVPVFGLYGAALGTVLGSLTLSSATLWIAQHIYRIPYEVSRLAKIAGVSVALYGAGAALRTGSPWIDLGVAAGLLACYPLALLIVRLPEAWELAAVSERIPALHRAVALARYQDRQPPR
jgi:O-antigen/teichoic acid export membrane protein